MADPSANRYIAAAAVLQADFLGTTRRYALIAPEGGGRLLVDKQLDMRRAQVEKTAHLDEKSLRNVYIPFL